MPLAKIYTRQNFLVLFQNKQILIFIQTMTQKKSISYYLLRIPAPLIMIISWYLSSQPTIAHMPTFWNADKVVHMICFAGLVGAWTFWFTKTSWNTKYWRNIFFCITIVAFYGIIDEIHQSFTPGRDANIFDWLADFIGAIIGSFAGSWIMTGKFIDMFRKRK